MKTFVLLLLSIWFSSSSFAESLIVDELSKKISADLFARFVIPDDPSFRFFQTPSQNWLIGLRQVFVVHAKPEKVAAILDDIK
ncbi:hypothetical protein C1Y11_29130, partial [Pseudomonas sp. FW305-20]|uniref:hypothetical protein n=1 Tax=Pseudomonas sp. FW305-20 TaxID=2070560 RepID=UPI000CC86148